MLMTVLRGKLAVRQSRALVRAFKAMKDYIVQNQPLIEQHRYLRMIAESQQQINDLRNDMQSYEALVMDHDEKLVQVIERLDDTVRKSELSPIMLDFSREDVQREFLFLDGQPMKAEVALRKLIMIDNAGCLEDLRVPPANRLEKLEGDRKGQYSIRINDQYRICFTVEGNNFFDVEIVDYH